MLIYWDIYVVNGVVFLILKDILMMKLEISFKMVLKVKKINIYFYVKKIMVHKNSFHENKFWFPFYQL